MSPPRRSGPRHAAPRRLALTRPLRPTPVSEHAATGTLTVAPAPTIQLAPPPREEIPTLPKEGPPGRDAAPPSGLVRPTARALALLLLGFAFQVQFGSSLHHACAQHIAYTTLRSELAQGTAPVSPRTDDGKPLAHGRPVAVLEIPSLGLREVVLEGSDAEVLEDGPGRRPDSAFPGQAGTSVVYGRQATYSGPFGKLGHLRRGDVIRVTTGQGVVTYGVLDRRRPGDLEPPALVAGQGRLTLATAAGSAFLPSGLLLVDAEQTSPIQPSGTVAPVGITPDELPLAADGLALVGIAVCAQLLLALVLGLAWARVRWGRWQSWVVAVPVITAVGIALFDRVALLLPNLM